LFFLLRPLPVLGQGAFVPFASVSQMKRGNFFRPLKEEWRPVKMIRGGAVRRLRFWIAKTRRLCGRRTGIRFAWPRTREAASNKIETAICLIRT
jgi:hypothetical protein